MSAAETQMPAAAKENLSAEARALLKELEGGVSGENAAIAKAFYAEPETTDVPVALGGPVNDSKALAFADLLDHLDDEVGVPHANKAGAQKAAERFRAERVRPTVQSAAHEQDAEATVDTMADGLDMSALQAGADMDSGLHGDETIFLEEEYGEADGDDFDDGDFDFDIDEKPGGLKGFFARLAGGGGRAVKRLVGVKDASSAYNAQSGATLLPYTIIRAVVLILVAAVPPAVNLFIIQPQISDNNRKITETLSFEAKSKEDEKIADKLAKTISNVERRSKVLMNDLMAEEKLQPLVNSYVAALQRYGVDLNSYNVASDASRKVIVGDMVQDAMVVEMDLVTRYDVYSEIRKVFVQQANKITVIDEVLAVQPGSVDLKVTSRVMIPVQRKFDEELDKPAAGEK